MNYRAVSTRCAVDFATLNLSITEEAALEILNSAGFHVVSVDISAEARAMVGKSAYKRGAQITEAPHVVDCSSLTKWVYGRCGIWLPRRSIQQFEFGRRVDDEERMEGDLIFTSGYRDYYPDDSSLRIGHVGMVTSEMTVIHAASRLRGVVEEELALFLQRQKIQAVCRFLGSGNTLVLETPERRHVETADDIRWIILQRL